MEWWELQSQACHELCAAYHCTAMASWDSMGAESYGEQVEEDKKTTQRYMHEGQIRPAYVDVDPGHVNVDTQIIVDHANFGIPLS